MTPSAFASTQRASTAAILITEPPARLTTATSPSRFTEVRDGSDDASMPVR